MYIGLGLEYLGGEKTYTDLLSWCSNDHDRLVSLVKDRYRGYNLGVFSVDTKHWGKKEELTFEDDIDFAVVHIFHVPDDIKYVIAHWTAYGMVHFELYKADSIHQGEGMLLRLLDKSDRMNNFAYIDQKGKDFALGYDGTTFYLWKLLGVSDMMEV